MGRGWMPEWQECLVPPLPGLCREACMVGSAEWAGRGEGCGQDTCSGAGLGPQEGPAVTGRAVTRQRPCDATGGSWARVRDVTGQPAPPLAGGLSRAGAWGSRGPGPRLAQAHLREVGEPGSASLIQVHVNFLFI